MLQKTIKSLSLRKTNVAVHHSTVTSIFSKFWDNFCYAISLQKSHINASVLRLKNLNVLISKPDLLGFKKMFLKMDSMLSTTEQIQKMLIWGFVSHNPVPSESIATNMQQSRYSFFLNRRFLFSTEYLLIQEVVKENPENYALSSEMFPSLCLIGKEAYCSQHRNCRSSATNSHF